jgi:NhaP-type Na+/H+ or K+/H+ antiporter
MEQGLNLAVTAAAAGSIVVWGMASGRLQRWNVTAPMFFVLAGWVLTNGPTGVAEVRIDSTGVRDVTELALALVLFGDAAQVRVRDLGRDAGPPARLLLIGLPLTMVLGTLVAKWVLPDLSWWVCAVVGIAVAPTDAALGAAIVEDERVPERVRRILNVESGLNDGIATPFVKLALVAAVAGTALETGSEGGALLELLIGAVGGALIGLVGGAALVRARATGWGTSSAHALAVAALAVGAFAAMDELGGNGFIAAFVAGLAYGAITRSAPDAGLHFTHQVGGLMSMLVWFIFGAVMLPVLQNAGWREIVFAALALTIVRMLPVALSLLGVGFDRFTVVVMGWFGPRGLASVVFALLAVDALAPADTVRVVAAITATVVASVVLHGASAAPVSSRYSAAEGS